MNEYLFLSPFKFNSESRSHSQANLFPSSMSNRSRNDGDRRTTPPEVDTMYSLKVDNLTYRTRVEDLRRCFEKFGPIGDIYIPRDQFSRSSRGYAFIRYVSIFGTLPGPIVSRLSTVFPKNEMPKMHWIVWMAPISTDGRFVFNLLVMDERRIQIVERKLDDAGK